MNNQYQATDESLLRGQETKKKSSIGLNLFSSSSKAGKTSADYDYSMLSTSEYVNMDLDAPKTQPQTQGNHSGLYEIHYYQRKITT